MKKGICVRTGHSETKELVETLDVTKALFFP